ncbi:MAG: hypothetical protein RL398_3139 [Planctomycetota bacterium]|jgi:uracil phosphoribosyltransferase
MLAHHYGPDVHLFADSYLDTLLARIGDPRTTTAEVPSLVRAAYARLCQEVLAREFPARRARTKTRMAATEPRGFVDHLQLCRDTKLVVTAVIRAGILPAQVCYEEAIAVLPEANVRIDFLNLSRTVDQNHQVTGVRLDGSKLGGPVDDAVVLVPDPMGATGSTVCRAVEIYENLTGRPPKSLVAIHLMVTPEAIQRVTAAHPGIKIYAGRLDRGLSSDRALAAEPGMFPAEERGLNDVQYIVPGAGGMGELLTNSWV